MAKNNEFYSDDCKKWAFNTILSYKWSHILILWQAQKLHIQASIFAADLSDTSSVFKFFWIKAIQK
ncbi:hypothetical protein CNR22_07670 [Sphingobacteriaceae bacterium]|nr:hypothetical protein CNR22_07670 [Sphingobacteriaceae bacterium]